MLNNIKLISLPLIATLSIATITHARAVKPGRCPATAKIREAGIQLVEKDDDYMGLISVINGGSLGKFGTNHQWAFMIQMPADQATSIQDARNKLTAALNTLRGTPKPMYDSDLDIWGCLYSNSYNYPAAAITPLNLDAMASSMSVTQSKPTMTLHPYRAVLKHT